MNESLGRVTVHLAEQPEGNVPNELIETLNANIRPPTPVTETDVFIRSMYVVSDEVNSFGGRFPVEEFDRLTKLLIDSPVLVGHRKDKLPIARNFHAVRTERDGRPWVRSYFFWMRGAEGAESLRENIDGGIYKECSIGFTFLLPECSVCGKDIRTCEHLPLHEYGSADGGNSVCHFAYRQIDRVLETSLVYRGATPNTTITKLLTGNPACLTEQPVLVGELSEIAEAGPFLVFPCYEGIPVTATISSGRLCMKDGDGTDYSSDVCARFPTAGLEDVASTAGMLVGYRGKERCPERMVRRHLREGSGPVTRLALHLVPRTADEALAAGDERSRYSVRTMRHRLVDRRDLQEAVRNLATKHGVRILALTESGVDTSHHYLVRPELMRPPTGYTLALHPKTNEARLAVYHEGARKEYYLQQFDLRRWQRGRRFVADRVGAVGRLAQSEAALFGEQSGDVDRRQPEATVEGTAEERVIVRPILLDGRDRFLCHVRAERVGARIGTGRTKIPEGGW